MSRTDIYLTPKQSMVFESTADEIFFGGAVGGGKSYVNKVFSIAACLAVPNVQVAIIRNTSKNLKKNYFMGEASIPNILADHIKTGFVKINYTDLVVAFSNNANIHFLHCDHLPSFLDNIQGLELQIAIPDEASLLPEEALKMVKTRLRLGSLTIENEFWRARLPKLLISSNPGGISHNYLKDRYISPAPPMTEFKDEVGKSIIFIPSSFRDNPVIDHDAYEKEIRSTGDPVRIAQLLDGDWDVGKSQFFGMDFKRPYNVWPTFKIPESWRVSRCYDDGYSSPFAVIWLAEVTDENEITLPDGRIRTLPRGSKVVCEEWYGYDGKDRSKGLKFQPNEIASGILRREEEYHLSGQVVLGPADNSIWNLEDNSIAAQMAKLGVRFNRSDKSPGSRSRGWKIIAEKLRNAHYERIEQPCLIFMEHCVHVIQDVVSAPVSSRDPDDIDTDCLDHTLDALRYGMSERKKVLVTAPVVGL